MQACAAGYAKPMCSSANCSSAWSLSWCCIAGQSCLQSCRQGPHMWWTDMPTQGLLLQLPSCLSTTLQAVTYAGARYHAASTLAQPLLPVAVHLPASHGWISGLMDDSWYIA